MSLYTHVCRLEQIVKQSGIRSTI